MLPETKRPALSALRFAMAGAGAMLWLAGGCENDSPVGPGERGGRGKEEPGRAPLVDETIDLFPRRIDRPDRIADASKTVLTRITDLKLPAPGERNALEREAEKLYPGEDWKSEQLSNRATERLGWLTHPLKSIEFAKLAAPEFKCGPLCPSGLEVVFESGRLIVYRPARGAAAAVSGLTGGAALEDALATLGALFEPGGMELTIKATGIELPMPDDAGQPSPNFRTRALVEVSGPLAQSSGRAQLQAEWICTWITPGAEEEPANAPRLLGLEVERYQESRLAAEPDSPPTLFVDATAEAMGKTACFGPQFLFGAEYWAKRLTRTVDYFLTGHQGLAVGDVNGDGLEDLYLCDGGGMPNRLFVQNSDGTVRDASAAAGVDFFESSRSALLLDLDNDGDQDLVVATVAIIVFAENNGRGIFTMRGGHPGAPYPTSISAADYDNDGDLDLYACVYEGDANGAGTRGIVGHTPVPFNDAENGGRNILLENLGDFRFADVTGQTGLEVNNTRWSFAASWEDYDRDGDADLYVANDFGRNCFYRNERGADGRPRFTEVAGPAGVQDTAAGMSVAWGDYNRDGYADLYVGNMFSSAGNRISYQRNFGPGQSASAVSGMQRMVRGNSLFAGNADSAVFADVSESAGVTMGRWAWSSAFADLNNDGWEDIVVANGMMTADREDDL
jgi:hypothetical protein